MKKVLVVLFGMAILLLAFISFDGNILTGYVIEDYKESFERASEKTEVTFITNPAKRTTTAQVKIIPGIKGVERRIELYRMVDGEERFIKSYVFCSWINCNRARIYPIFISKAYYPGTYVLVVHDRLYGDVRSYFEVA